MVFVFYLFAQPPMLFERTAMKAIATQPAYTSVQSRYNDAWSKRERAARALNAARQREDSAALNASIAAFRAAQKDMEGARQSGVQLYQKATHESAFNDTNYIFLTFVTRYFPAGVIGLVIAVILNAAMSSSSGELNSLAAVSVMDLYRRLWRPDETDRHYLIVSRVCTAIWGAWAVIFAQYAKNLGSLVEAVNQVGSYFYPVLLGVFILAFFFPRVRGGAAFWAMLTGETVIVAISLFTHIAFLWYNVIGAVVVVLAGWLLSVAAGQPPAPVLHVPGVAPRAEHI
jgi:Na+/proline symporter